MNWDAIGAVSEGLGAAAVFVTLAYLAVQVRQSTAAQRNASRLEAMKGMTDWHSTMVAHPDLQRVWTTGFLGDAPMSESDRSLFVWSLALIGHQLERIYSQYKVELIDQELWTEYRGWFAGAIDSNTIVRAWWESRASVYPNDFRCEIDSTPPELIARQWTAGLKVATRDEPNNA